MEAWKWKNVNFFYIELSIVCRLILCKNKILSWNTSQDAIIVFKHTMNIYVAGTENETVNYEYIRSRHWSDDILTTNIYS